MTMKTKYLVRKIETCPECNGDGHIANKDWQRINRENVEWMEAHGIKPPSDEAIDDWNRRIRQRWPYGDPPPEEELCGECEGTGTIETEVDLLDALDELGVYMPSFWSERAEAKQGVSY